MRKLVEVNNLVEIDTRVISNGEGRTINPTKVRSDFPILHRQVHCKPLVYLDNAASTQKPQSVIDTIDNFYSHMNSNIHRGVHFLSQRSTREYDTARRTVKEFINAKEFEEVIFTRGTTESNNLIAATYGRKFLNEGDEVIISHMEHHSNIVPWQMICEERGALLKVIPINNDGELIMEEYEKLLSERTKIVAVVHVSNSLGTINPVKEIIDMAHNVGAKVLIDGAQSIQHVAVDVQELDCDFFSFSGHKLYGPTGIGVFYGKKELLEAMPPYQGGGDMIMSVTFDQTTFNDLPYKFEAGTPNIAGAIGLGAAIEYVQNIGLDVIERYEHKLLSYATEKLNEIDGFRMIGTAKKKSSVAAFVMDKLHPMDIGTMLDMEGVAIRTGHHCTEPLMHYFGVPATSRASFAFYNTIEEVDILVDSIKKVQKLLL
jgi:cysteine desulfurase / selenocysteine lyase